MEAGDTLRSVCPSCGGGSTKERSMNISLNDEGAILFLCWRASCGVRGVIGGSPTRLTNFVRTKPRPSKVKEDISYRFVDIADVTDYRAINLQNWKFGYPDLHQFGILWDPETARLAMPVYSPLGRIRGWVLRSLDGRTPKTLAWPTADEPQLGWNKTARWPEQVVVVEDIPSAIRLGQFGVRAVSILGTHLSTEAMDEIIHEAEEVVWALDRDAFAKAQRLERDNRLHFRRSATLLLPKDFKDQTDTEVQSCLRNVAWLRSLSLETPM